MKLSEVFSWRLRIKSLSFIFIIGVFLFYNRFNEILWTKLYKVNEFNSYIFHRAELQVPSSKLQFQHGRMIANTCPHTLNEEKIMHNNLYWQQMTQSDGKIMYLYSSYYDNRTLLKNNPVIRIIAMFDKPYEPVNFYCYIWFENEEFATVAKATHIFQLSYLKLKYFLIPYIITCPIPFEVKYKIPSSVSLHKNKCSNITNLIPVVNNQPENFIKKDFAVCIKALDFVDIDMSHLMVEKLELLFLMGVDKVYAYKYTVHPNISKVLQHYIDIGRLTVTPLTLPGDFPNEPKLRHQYLDEKTPGEGYVHQIVHEKIPLNDCFYQNMNRYKYIVNLDLDEIIIPKNHTTLKDLMTELTLNEQFVHPSYEFKETLFLDSMRELHGWSEFVPKYMYMSQNVYRSPVYEKQPKSLFNTDHVIGMGCHRAVACLNTYKNQMFKCKSRPVNPSFGYAHHYRKSCKKGHTEFCLEDRSIRDDTILRYRTQLIEKTSNTLKKLGLV